MHGLEFEQFFRKHDAVFLLMDADTGQLLDANDAALRFYGYTLPQIQAMRVGDINQLSPDELDAERQRAATANRAYFVVPHRLASGEIRTVEVHTTPVVSEDGTCLFSVIHDITELGRARETLRERSQALADAEHVAHMGSWHWDIASDTITWSEELCRLNGHDPDLPTPSYEEHLKMYTPQSAQRLSAAVQAAMEWVPYKLDVELVRPDGSRWFGEACGEPVLGPHGDIVGLHGTLTDITGRVRAEEALREAEDMFEWVFSGSAVPKSITSATGEARVNAAFCEMLGYTQDDLADGTTWMELTHPEDVAETQWQMEMLISGEQDAAHYEKRFLRKDGAVVWADVHSALRRGTDGQSLYFGTTMLDVTERKRVEEALREGEARYRSIIDASPVPMALNDDAGNITYLNPAFTSTFGYTLEDIPTLAEWWPRAYPEAGHRQRVADAWEAELERARQSGEDFAPIEATIACKDGSKRTALVGAGLHPRNLCILEGFASVAPVPIRDKQRIVGLIHLADCRKGCFNAETVQLLEGIAIHIGEAMTRKRAEERISRTLTSVIDIARDIVEVRDPYTVGHQLRVREIAVRVAKNLGMSAADVEDVRIAALIHDVGKVVVPTEILSKPGPISKTEYELLKAHAEAGHRILDAAHMEEPIPELVYQHHERCDGSGYPRGLTGDQMLMGAKVIAVADAVEAMTSHRPYRPALGLYAALAEIERGGGRLYDPDVARACIALFREHHFELPTPPA